MGDVIKFQTITRNELEGIISENKRREKRQADKRNEFKSLCVKRNELQRRRSETISDICAFVKNGDFGTLAVTRFAKLLDYAAKVGVGCNLLDKVYDLCCVNQEIYALENKLCLLSEGGVSE